MPTRVASRLLEQLPVIGLAVWAANARAAVHYVDVGNLSPSPPYTTWASAASTIQEAIDVAQAGDEILVTNGVYQTGGVAMSGTTTNRVAVTKAVTVRSVNGPEVTVIRGYQVPGTVTGDGAVRCVYLASGAALSGFALTNGATRAGSDDPEAYGGGVWCESSSAVVSNCLFLGNWAGFGGGAYGGTLRNCRLTGNRARQDGGGAHSSTLNECDLEDNSAQSYYGGGAMKSTLSACVVRANSAQYGGGVSESTLTHCTVSWNEVGFSGGGAWHSTMQNCALLRNFAGRGGGAYGGTLNNCTIVGNAGAIYGGGAYMSALTNCVVYHNQGSEGLNHFNSTLSYCCTIPLPAGLGNFTNAPTLVSWTDEDLRLDPGSPCINAGHNSSATIGADLDGNPRIVGGTVDVGAYEFQTPTSYLSYAWLQSYGLPTDGTADTTDNDTDGMNNCEECRAGTNPTNALSALRLRQPLIQPPSVFIRWESSIGRMYFVDRSTNAGPIPVFLPWVSSVVGRDGTTTLRDDLVAGGGPILYRVGVQP